MELSQTQRGPGALGPWVDVEGGFPWEGNVFLCPAGWPSQGFWFVSHQQGQQWEGLF